MLFVVFAAMFIFNFTRDLTAIGLFNYLTGPIKEQYIDIEDVLFIQLFEKPASVVNHSQDLSEDLEMLKRQ